VSQSLANVVALATTPISDAKPTGEYVRLDPAFEQLRAEIEKMYTGGMAGVEWKKVVALCSDITGKKSKDLLVLSYLCCGLFQLDGFTGLAEGLDALHQVMSSHWDKVFPDRAKAKVSAVTWLSEKAAAAIPQKKAAVADRNPIQAAIEKVGLIDAFLGEKLGGDAPSLREFTGALEEVLSGLPEPATAAPAPAPPSGEPAAAPSAVAAAPAVVDDLATPEGIEEALRRAYSHLAEVARARRRAVPQDPVPYKVFRILTWSGLTSLPDNDGGTTVFPPPDVAGLTERYEGMASASQWADLLEEAESLFEQMPIWFDLQRHAARALKGLGKDYGAALSAVNEELVSLLRRVPGILDLKFNDGTPFTSDPARAWIQQEVLAAAGGGVVVAGPASGGGGGEDAAFEEAMTSARDLARDEKLDKALSLLCRAADAASSRRQRFRRRLAVARLLAERREHRLAAAVLDALDEDIRQFRLEEWEPELSLDAVRLHLQCRRVAMGDGYEASPESARKAEDLFTRLARLDAGAALKMQAG
jgi:type VI secretion system protein VasJ